MFTVCYEAWSLSLVEREEHVKLCMYFSLVRGTPTQPVIARRLIQRKQVLLGQGEWGLKNLVGVAVDSARCAGIIQEPAVSQPGRIIP